MTDPTINPCPCCGGECIVSVERGGRQRVVCAWGCGYECGAAMLVDTAIDIHNRATDRNGLIPRAKLRAWVEGQLDDLKRHHGAGYTKLHGTPRGKVSTLHALLRYLDGDHNE